MKHCIVITGPTATGKTALAVRLARRLHTEVISADSMQVYTGMDIGTAKPTLAEQEGVVHHLLDVCAPESAFSVARYVALATPIVERLLTEGKTPIIAGGTGQYIDALLKGEEFSAFSGARRSDLQQQLEADGIGPLLEDLKRIDPDRAAILAPNDHKRILRALEVFYETGETITAHDARSKTQPPRFPAHTFVLQYAQRADLYERIDRRVDEMLALGLLDEIERLLAQGVPTGATAMQAIGYKELIPPVLSGEGLDEAVALLKQRSRNYAKRQLTWHRRNTAAIPIVWKQVPDLTWAMEKICEVNQ